MNKFWVCTISVLLISSSAFSQLPDKPFDIYVGAGLSMPVSQNSDLSDNYKTGFHGMAGIGFNINPYVETVLKIEYHSMARDWSYPAPPGGEGGTLQAMFGGADLRLSPKNIGSPVFPYLFGGVGVAIFTVSELTGSTTLAFASNDNSKIYVDIGAGIEIVTGNSLTLFAQGSYVSVAFDNEKRAFVPFTVGLKF
jgi:opacity protein-like surface antigen